MREISRRSWPQTRQSSGKTRENRPQESLPAARSTTSGNGTQRPRLGRLLEKTHLHLTVLVYNNWCESRNTNWRPGQRVRREARSDGGRTHPWRAEDAIFLCHYSETSRPAPEHRFHRLRVDFLAHSGN